MTPSLQLPASPAPSPLALHLSKLSLKFCLKLYPNGSCAETAGRFLVELVLVSLPSLLNTSGPRSSSSTPEATQHAERLHTALCLDDLRLLRGQRLLSALTFDVTLDVIRITVIRIGVPALGLGLTASPRGKSKKRSGAEWACSCATIRGTCATRASAARS